MTSNEKLKLLKNFGLAIAEARDNAFLTQKGLCKKAGISTDTLWQIEKGLSCVTYERAKHLCIVLGVEFGATQTDKPSEMLNALNNAISEWEIKNPKHSIRKHLASIATPQTIARMRKIGRSGWVTALQVFNALGAEFILPRLGQ